ncbi:hypothetical protein SPRA44_280061 [Serratia proteamaculans]|nr:hypothetical protein SPRA44_280061 [Serratia proteamaculans]
MVNLSPDWMRDTGFDGGDFLVKVVGQPLGIRDFVLA